MRNRRCKRCGRMTARTTGYCGRCEELVNEDQQRKRKRIAEAIELRTPRHIRMKRAGQ